MKIDRIRRLRAALPPSRDDEWTMWAGVRLDDLRALLTEFSSLTEWAKLAFTALNNVGPVLLSLEGESTEESELTAKLYQMVESACWQYPVIAGVRCIEASKDARQALKVGEA